MSGVLVAFPRQIGDIVNRLSVTMPRPRDGKVRTAHIPDSVRLAREAASAAGGAKAGAGAGRGMGDDSDDDDEDDEDDDGMGAMPTSIVGTGPGGRVLMKDVEREKGTYAFK